MKFNNLAIEVQFMKAYVLIIKKPFIILQWTILALRSAFQPNIPRVMCSRLVNAV